MIPSLPRGPGIRGALLTTGVLGGAVFLVFPALGVVNLVAPEVAQALAPWLFLALLGVFCAGGAYLWARLLARAGDAGQGRRSGGAAAGAFGVTAPVAVYFLTVAESIRLPPLPGGRTLPVHLLFALIFPAATFVVAGSTALAVGVARGRLRDAARTGLAVGVTAFAAFAAVDLAFDLAGMRIGAPGAEQRFTMLVVMACGILASSLSAGAVLGRALATVGEGGSDGDRTGGRMDSLQRPHEVRLGGLPAREPLR
ncbi:MAG TPA: hypothetical protein VFJ82_25045 [Longimicrobium sp.]|nr:hypothetical protein [Longimicrobium sp.]